MPVFTTTPGATNLLPAENGELVVQPASPCRSSRRSSPSSRPAPAITASPDHRRPDRAVGGGGRRDHLSDPTLAEFVVTPAKVAGLTVASREVADDSDPAVAGVVGEGLARSIATRVDQAALAGLAAPAPACGLSTLSGVQSYVNGFALGNLDFAA